MEAFDVLTSTPGATARGIVTRNIGSAAGAASNVNTASTSVTHTSVAANAASVTLIAANASRVRVSIWNDPAGGAGAILYIRLDPSAASATNGVLGIAANGYWEAPVDYTGEIRGIWASASGAARIGEYNP